VGTVLQIIKDKTELIILDKFLAKWVGKAAINGTKNVIKVLTSPVVSRADKKRNISSGGGEVKGFKRDVNDQH
jgi:hypothetical protein